MLRSLARPAIISSRLVRCYAEDAAAKTGKVKLTFASPNNAFYNSVDVEQINVPSTNGDFGILASHVPTLAILRPGVVAVIEGAETKKFFVSSGTISINADSTCQIAAEEAVPLERLDGALAKSSLTAATTRLGSASNDQDKAEAEIQVEVYTSMCHALGV